MNNWDALIRLIVPLSFMAIWALTSLFNREAKIRPEARPMPRPHPGPLTGLRSAEPTLRWSSAPNPGSTAPGGSTPPRRPPTRVGGDDGIVILSSDNNQPDRGGKGRPLGNPSSRRPSKGKPVVPPRPVEPTTTRPRLAGVSQNVNQHLTHTNIEMVPLAAMPPIVGMPSLGLSAAPTVAPDTIGVSPRSAAALALADPKRIREALILNEILLPPVSMRTRRIGPTPQ